MENLKNISFQLDMVYQKIQNIGTLVQFDTNANVLKIKLTNQNEVYDLTDASSINVSIKDDEQFLTSQSCTIEDAANGLISFVLPDNCIGYRRTFTGEVQVNMPGARLTSSLFQYEVRQELAVDADPSQDPDFPILNQLISDVETLETNVETAEADRVAAEDTRVSNENTRISNENTRQSQESTRQSQESSRVTAESSRVTAENGRVTAENTRVSQEDTRQSNEATRQSQETTRENQETVRESNEDTREANEVIRKQFDFIGDYDNTVQYLENNVVLYDNSSYVALKDTLGNLPPTFPTTENEYWQLASRKGVDGTNLAYQGVYNELTTYNEHDLVTYNSKLYHAKVSTTGDLPSNLNDWELFFNGGSIGEIDGGNAFSTYTAEQVIEGGDAYGN